MNFDQAQEIISLLKEHNDLQRHRNNQLSALHTKLDDIRIELNLIKGNM